MSSSRYAADDEYEYFKWYHLFIIFIVLNAELITIVSLTHYVPLCVCEGAGADAHVLCVYHLCDGVYLAILCIYSIMLCSLPLYFIDSCAAALSQSIFSPRERTIRAPVCDSTHLCSELMRARRFRMEESQLI